MSLRQHAGGLRRPSCAPRRGMALLLVLAAVVVGLSAATIAAQAATTAMVSQRVDRRQAIVDDAALALGPALEAWLAQRSATVVLDPTANAPMVEVLRESCTLELDREPCTIDIAVLAFDQRGMVPWEDAVRGDGLAAALPPTVARRFSDDGRASVAPGLDLVAARSRSEAFDIPVWPTVVRGSSQGEETPLGLGVAAFVATHGRGVAVVNVNTAPEGVVRAAEAMLGRSVWEVVREHRALGKPAPVGAFTFEDGGRPVEVGDASAARLPRFVASSDVWSFAVEVRCEGARSAWWVTYGRASGGWRVLQRVRVVE